MKVYSVNTEETLRLMSGHADLVTGIQLNPHNHMQVCGGGPDPRVPPRGCPGAGWSLGRGWEGLGHPPADVSLGSDKKGRAVSVFYKHKREMLCGSHSLNGMTTKRKYRKISGS